MIDALLNSEYIIKESQLAGILFALEDVGVPKNNLLFKEIRSHSLSEHDKQVREKVLGEILAIERPYFDYALEESGFNWLMDKIAELRGAPC